MLNNKISINLINLLTTAAVSLVGADQRFVEKSHELKKFFKLQFMELIFINETKNIRIRLIIM